MLFHWQPDKKGEKERRKIKSLKTASKDASAKKSLFSTSKSFHKSKNMAKMKDRRDEDVADINIFPNDRWWVNFFFRFEAKFRLFFIFINDKT